MKRKKCAYNCDNSLKLCVELCVASCTCANSLKLSNVIKREEIHVLHILFSPNLKSQYVEIYNLDDDFDVWKSCRRYKKTKKEVTCYFVMKGKQTNVNERYII